MALIKVNKRLELRFWIVVFSVVFIGTSNSVYCQAPDKEELKPEVTQFILPEVITEMIKRPSLRILIEGHADEDGSEKYNLGLSMRRAQAVADFLINAGISSNRIDIQGLGESAPAVQGSDEDARARNRRAVILENTPI